MRRVLVGDACLSGDDVEVGDTLMLITEGVGDGDVVVGPAELDSDVGGALGGCWGVRVWFLDHGYV